MGNLAVDGRLIKKQVLKWYVCTVFKRLRIGPVIGGAFIGRLIKYRIKKNSV